MAFIRLLLDSCWAWRANGAQRRGAALAYYTLFSIAPMMFVLVAILGFFFGKNVSKGLILEQVRGFLGNEGAAAVAEFLANLKPPHIGRLPGFIGVATLFVGASGVVNELQDSLNQIWKAPARRTGWAQLVVNRLISFAFVLAIAFLLLVSLLLGAASSQAAAFLGSQLNLPGWIFHSMNAAVSFGVVTVLFALMYKFLPQATVGWHDVWVGALTTAALFSFANFLLGFYLSRSGVVSVFGAAGSIVLILVWTYYCAQILYFGAEFTRVYAERFGSRSKKLYAGSTASLERQRTITRRSGCG